MEDIGQKKESMVGESANEIKLAQLKEELVKEKGSAQVPGPPKPVRFEVMRNGMEVPAGSNSFPFIFPLSMGRKPVFLVEKPKSIPDEQSNSKKQ